MAISAAEVKRLRDETDAPMMECKAALEEAGGDFEKAKAILREKGKAAATKRAGRSTSAGVVAIARSSNHRAAGAVVLECETDFVARNEEFIVVAQELAEIFLHHDPGSDPQSVSHGNKSVGQIVEECVAKFRENVRLTRALHLEGENLLATYVHHDKTKGSIVELSGSGEVALDTGHKLAIQSVAFPPQAVRKEDLSQEMLAAELATEKQRAMNEGKPAEIAEKIAQGRVNKEFINQVVLLEQTFYLDNAKSVGQYVAEQGKASGAPFDVVRFHYLAVGQE
jgi:elongation factor Ts